MSGPAPIPTTQPTDSATAPPPTGSAPTPGAGFSMPSISSLGSTANVGMLILWGIIALLPWFLVSYGAAKLSFAKYGSYGWSILDFFFAGFYYPFYAWFLNEPSQPAGFMGGRRSRY
uniref:Uncharacterized protein n=1 Tax=viral metagenome TaxID=1070528 RepID=A0A6C0AI72_9ZZZZ